MYGPRYEYSSIYFDLIDFDKDILEQMAENFQVIRELIYSLSEEQLLYRYDSNKWTIKEILVHIIDDERIFAYRAVFRVDLCEYSCFPRTCTLSITKGREAVQGFPSKRSP